MKTIDSIIIHCSATRFGQDLRAKDIDRMHKQRGFNQIGYNYVIDIDGTVGTVGPCLWTGHIAIRKGTVGGRITNIRLVSAISAAWMSMGKLLIPGQKRNE